MLTHRNITKYCGLEGRVREPINESSTVTNTAVLVETVVSR